MTTSKHGGKDSLKGPKGNQQTAKSKQKFKDKESAPTNSISERVSTLNLYAPARATVEILDDASPDVTPRGLDGDDHPVIAEKIKQQQYRNIEQNFRNLTFSEEQSRILSTSDLFIPSASVTTEDIERERQRLHRIQESSKLKSKLNQSEVSARAEYLREDRAALKLQSFYRGHLGRRQFDLVKQLQLHVGDDNAVDWIEVTDKNTGDIWYYNQKTNKSQWNKPEVLVAIHPLPQMPINKGKSKTSSKKDVNHNGDMKIKTKSLAVSISLPSLDAMNASKGKTHKTTPLKSKPFEPHINEEEDSAAIIDVNKELGIDKLMKPEALTNPDGSFKTQLRTVVLDALLDTRFDNVSTVLADTRWFENQEEPFPRVVHKNNGVISTSTDSMMQETKVNHGRAPLVAVFNLNQKKKVKKATIQAISEGGFGCVEQINKLSSTKGMTINEIEHTGFEDSAQFNQQSMCFGCWSSGMNRRCSLHEGTEKLRPSQTMLLCRNWDLDVMRRRYRSEEIQEIFLKKEASLRYDAKHKKFHTVVEQKHPIYRMQNQMLEKFNTRMMLFARIKYWINSLRDEFRQGKVHPSTAEQARLRQLFRSMMHLAKVDRFTKLHHTFLPIAPITGYSWPERCGNEQYLFQQKDVATGQMVDVIKIEPIPVPKKLYLPREYHVGLPKTVPLPQGGFSEQLSGDHVVPGNVLIPDVSPAGWLERLSSNLVRDNMDMAMAQVKALTPVTPTELLSKAKRPPPSTIKFATIGQKPTPGNMAIGGLPAELLVYQVISTHFPPQYGNFMVMDKASVSPAVSPEISISFQSLVMPPTVEPYVERPLEHPLTYRRAPTIALNSQIGAEQKHHYGSNRPEQTGEQESHGFRTTAWAPQLSTFEEIDPQVFVPGQGVVSLNAPKANVSSTTHADHTYPFCEPSTRDNSTLDFYHLLLQGVVSSSKAQIFTALTVQEPGQFQKAYNTDLPMGHLVVSVYRSWAFTQQDTIQEFLTDDGVPYWYHRKTGQTFWQRPLFEDEESSPLNGGTILDQDHPEEPCTIVKGAEGAERRYLQGVFRKQMMMHIETKKDALNRRKAASSTVRYAKERGVIPDLTNPSIANNPNSTVEFVSQIDYSRPPNHSIQTNNESSRLIPLSALEGESNMIQIQSSQNTHQLMNMYGDSANNRLNNMAEIAKGSNYDQSSLLPASGFGQSLPMSPLGQHGQNFGVTMPTSRPTTSGVIPTLPVTPSLQGPAGMDVAFMNQLSQTLGNMFSMMMNMDRANPQDMIQLGLGMGMALMQTGVVNNMVQGQINQEKQLLEGVDEDEEYRQPPNEDPALGAFPSVSEQLSMEMSEGFHSKLNARPSRISSAHDTGPVGPEPIGLPYPTAVYSSDKTLDHHEEEKQKIDTAKRFNHPLNTMERARNLKIEQSITETPDVAPPKVLTDVKPSNAEDGFRETNEIPVLAYPELATQVPGGAPAPYHHKPPAGMGTSFVAPEQAESQLRVPGADHLRRTVMPLPVGFFEAIEAKHVAQQAADYLPQVPNLPQSRTIGRVKPRSAAADWLMISFDPWSAGKNPLSTEFVPSLMAKADKILGAQGADIIDALRQSTVSGAFISVEDEDGLAQQRAEITKAQVLSQDFKKLCSLCRHSKFADAEQLINQPDWSVPIDFQDEQGNALLHVACQNGSKRLVKLCLRRGASLDIQNLNGQTPLHFAFGYGYTDVGDYLVSKGADDSIRNKDGLTCYEGLGARELALL